jgi:hypothetical protein
MTAPIVKYEVTLISPMGEKDGTFICDTVDDAKAKFLALFPDGTFMSEPVSDELGNFWLGLADGKYRLTVAEIHVPNAH